LRGTFEAIGGSVEDKDWEANERALREGTRLLSVYHTAEGFKFWVITEWDLAA
jgi:hypothetical protein